MHNESHHNIFLDVIVVDTVSASDKLIDIKY